MDYHLSKCYQKSYVCNGMHKKVNACYDVHKKYHSLTIFSTYLNFMHHGGKLENICSLKFCNR